MKNLNKNYIFLNFLLLAGAIFLFAPVNKAEAADYGCIKYGLCTNITADDEMESRRECGKFCGTFLGPDCEATPVPCFDPGGPLYGCIKDGVCENIEANDSMEAARECGKFCKTFLGPSCKIASKPCPAPEKPGPLAGATLDKLKELAKASTNKANFSEPTDLINRAIRILMAFIGSIALVLYIFAGFMWMTASGNAEKVTKAKTTMVWTTLGVLMMLASYMLASFLFKSLGV
ncbi:MAG: hypothetical protein UT67_C0005G0022 [Candidatus Magasanikbacteria bacterium GW2011_GWA2_40_10]|uniref:Uncharacterized protein n=1 Tax=Candidatus Magasanikbacteria bacterium GW2011_GWA2_40_10 TaxID=1619037 RepID=A0A0G0SJM0_9BACT|nr:MAG: hypothetical protein UT67_C0005G0022 [Candidatus Magasanikbacteria bacterium GW2011_GWA2_40_10]